MATMDSIWVQPRLRKGVQPRLMKGVQPRPSMAKRPQGRVLDGGADYAPAIVRASEKRTKERTRFQNGLVVREQVRVSF